MIFYSRFDVDFFTSMIAKDTCIKLIVSSTELIMQFNARYGWIPSAYMPNIKLAYGMFQLLLTQQFANSLFPMQS
jgi:hypothetical protein